MKTLLDSPHAWIDDACRQFSRGLGWELQFLPLGDKRGTNIEARLRADEETCWFSEVADGQGRIGYLRLVLPANDQNKRTLAAAADLAESFGQLVNRCANAARQAQSRANELSTLVDIGRSIPTLDNLAGAIDRLMRAAIQLTSFRAAAFFLLDPSTERLRLRAVAHRGDRLVPSEIRNLAENPPDREALTRGRIVLTGEAAVAAVDWLPAQTATAVCLAVGSEAGPIGTLWVYDRRRREPPDREIHVLDSIAAQIASVLERVVLLRESAAQQRLQRDLKLASQCQTFDVATSLVPGAAIEAAVRSTSCFEIGGDLCELIPIDESRTIIAIGDASGHGVAAAIVMSVVRGAVRALAIDPMKRLAADDVVAQVNRALCGVTPDHQFMSLFYGIIDTRRQQLAYSNAGHPSPFLMGPAGPVQLDSHGMLLGVLSDAKYGASVLPLRSGDTLIAFTDGVSEAMNAKRKMFRSDGIVEVFAANRAGGPQVILEAIWSHLENHLAGGAGHDDRSLMVIRIR